MTDVDLDEHRPYQRHAPDARSERTRKAVLEVLTEPRPRANGVQSTLLVTRTGRSKPTVMRALRRLIDSGHVEWRRDEFDGRAIRYRLTDTGWRHARG